MFFSRKAKGTPAGERAVVAPPPLQSGVNDASTPVGATSAALAAAGAVAFAATQPAQPMIAPAASAADSTAIVAVEDAGSSALVSHPAPAGALVDEQMLQARRLKARQAASSFGRIVSVMARSRPYQAMPLSELRYLAIPAMATGQFIAADGLIDQKRPDGPFGPIAVVTWACVSEDIDRALLAEPNAPFRLFVKDYTSGEIPWIIEAAGRKPVVDKLVAQLLETEFRGRPVKVRMRADDGRVTAGVYNGEPAAPAA